MNYYLSALNLPVTRNRERSAPTISTACGLRKTSYACPWDYYQDGGQKGEYESKLVGCGVRD